MGCPLFALEAPRKKTIASTSNLTYLCSHTTSALVISSPTQSRLRDPTSGFHLWLTLKCPLIKIFLRARGAGPLWHPSPHGWSETCVCLSGQQTLTTRESLQSLVFIECLLCQKPHQFDLMCLSYHVYFAMGRLSPSNPNHCSVSDSKRVDKSAVILNVSARLKFQS